MARTTGDVLFRQDKQVVMEGQEPANFWVALGGKSAYASDKRSNQEFLKTHSSKNNVFGVFNMFCFLMMDDLY